MPLDLASPQRAALTDRIAPQWRAPLAYLAVAWLALFAVFAKAWSEMALQWWDSSTYNHILLVPLILAWLVWQRAPELAKLTPRPWWPGLVGFAGALFIWLLGDISGLATATHLGAVLALQAITVALIGPRVAWALLFPLCYAIFLVPIGEELVPALQMITADITIALTEASGIPARIDGVFIDTPAGLFEVAEACSGVKFLIAMIALGTLVAHVCFDSWLRRIAFMAVAIILPIIANGVRAWGTIYIAQSQGISFAAGFDHIFYGWIFFALVMGALLAMGWKFFDRSVEDPFIDGSAIANSDAFNWVEQFVTARRTVVAGALAVALIAFAWATAARSLEAELPAQANLADVPGWTRVDTAQSYPWHPRASGADRRLSASYTDADGRVVEVVLALYAAQNDGREAGGFGDGALPPDTEWRWLSATQSGDGVQGDRLQALGLHQRVAETWYRRGDWVGGSKIMLKLNTMRDKLFLQSRPTAMLILSTEQRAGEDAAQTIADFRSSTAGLGEWIDRAANVD
ncbi:exosortase A [Aurantiacibacter sediminis]|uniref:Exosortase A n=1 Tax=Aurantiacibacter sediminis TaxID=2793064 RepID=A0ABS0N460_9SPHN|nr:exosortase A [Aurantiacibacter sediminis]MBH5322761.1 exosortase A [Aurantiacibacter sediminis]